MAPSVRVVRDGGRRLDASGAAVAVDAETVEQTSAELGEFRGPSVARATAKISVSAVVRKSSFAAFERSAVILSAISFCSVARRYPVSLTQMNGSAKLPHR